jgi:hypothetical protein
MQRMEPGEQAYRGGYEGYEGERAGPTPQQMADDNFMEAIAQRVAHHTGKVQQPESKPASAGQRLALAIVSIALLPGIVAIATSNESPAGWFALPIIGIVTLGIFLINAAFNRWWFR